MQLPLISPLYLMDSWKLGVISRASLILLRLQFKMSLVLSIILLILSKIYGNMKRRMCTIKWMRHWPLSSASHAQINAYLTVASIRHVWSQSAIAKLKLRSQKWKILTSKNMNNTLSQLIKSNLLKKLMIWNLIMFAVKRPMWNA